MTITDEDLMRYERAAARECFNTDSFLCKGGMCCCDFNETCRDAIPGLVAEIRKLRGNDTRDTVEIDGATLDHLLDVSKE